MTPTQDFEPKAAAKKLLREGRSAALATLMVGSGDPYCSLVNIATAVDGTPLLLISRLAVHTRNLMADPRASLMIDERKAGDPLQGARVMLMGAVCATDDTEVRRRYLDRQPEAEMFAGFSDFSFYRLQLKSAHLVAGFGRIVDLEPADMLTPVDDAMELTSAEPDIVAHMNADHADTCRLYATRLLGASDGAWRCVGCDPEGLELQLERTALRLPFPQRVHSPTLLRQVLKELADRARVA
ncbi:MAG: HugZ family protein [Hyphomicrobiales bacterium]|nr:HugZ family protein [Hyphomicrobiales bacterium]